MYLYFLKGQFTQKWSLSSHTHSHVVPNLYDLTSWNVNMFSLVCCLWPSTKEQKSYRFGTSWGWVNDDTMLIFELNYFFKFKQMMLYLHKHPKQDPNSGADQTDEGFLWRHQAQHNTNSTTHYSTLIYVFLPKVATQTQSTRITCVSVWSVTRVIITLWLAVLHSNWQEPLVSFSRVSSKAFATGVTCWLALGQRLNLNCCGVSIGSWTNNPFVGS